MIHDAAWTSCCKKSGPAGASTRRKRCGFIIFSLEELARLPTGGVNSPGPALTRPRQRNRHLYRLTATSTTPTSAMSIASSARFTGLKGLRCLRDYVRRNGPEDRETLALGGTQILKQGGQSSEAHQAVVSRFAVALKAKFPQVNIHGFSPSEFVHFASLHEPRRNHF